MSDMTAPEANDRARFQLQQEFLNLIMEATTSGDRSALTAWWHEHFPGHTLLMIGPGLSCCDEEERSEEAI